MAVVSVVATASAVLAPTGDPGPRARRSSGEQSTARTSTGRCEKGPARRRPRRPGPMCVRRQEGAAAHAASCKQGTL